MSKLVKWNTDVLRLESSRSTTNTSACKVSNGNMIEGISYQIGDCPVLIVETLDIRESISVHGDSRFIAEAIFKWLSCSLCQTLVPRLTILEDL